jgi:uncharacterized protein YwgA
MAGSVPPFYLILNLVKAGIRDLGRLKIQKLIYLAAQAGVPAQASYHMYHFGPFSSDVQADIYSLVNARLIALYETGYELTEEGHAVLGLLKGAIAEPDEERLDRVIRDFGAMPAKDLEVLATCLMIDRGFRTATGKVPTIDAVVEAASQAKPQFTSGFIRDRARQLRKHSYLFA